MSDVSAVQQERQELLQRLFPQGIPRLWVPPLTHYGPAGELDRERIVAHLRSLAPYARGWLVPGSTGDGWEMDEEEIRSLLDLVLQTAQQVGAHVLIGVLRTDGQQVLQQIQTTAQWLVDRAAGPAGLPALLDQRVCGFTVCPPKGADLSQETITRSLQAVLELDWPVALYQLPQVTENEMTPATVQLLARQYANFYLLKDTSGQDRVAQSGIELDNLVLVRGAEGEYARRLRMAGGPYDGFLLSTANCFARPLFEMIELLRAGEQEAAMRRIRNVERVVQRVFELVADFPAGNAFANANKALDHFMAYGPEAGKHPAPRLHAGICLPEQLLMQTGKLLSENGLMPARGYL